MIRRNGTLFLRAHVAGSVCCNRQNMFEGVKDFCARFIACLRLGLSRAAILAVRLRSILACCIQEEIHWLANGSASRELKGSVSLSGSAFFPVLREYLSGFQRASRNDPAHTFEAAARSGSKERDEHGKWIKPHSKHQHWVPGHLREP